MRNPFFHNQLSRKEKAQIDEEYARPKHIRITFGLIILGLILSSYSLHFENKLIHILSDSSMKDDLDTLTMSEKRSIKRMTDTLFKKQFIIFSFHITNKKLSLPALKENSLFIFIDPQKEDTLIHLPHTYTSYQDQLENDLNLCLFTERARIGACMENALVSFSDFIDTEIKIQEQNTDSPYNIRAKYRP